MESKIDAFDFSFPVRRNGFVLSVANQKHFDFDKGRRLPLIHQTITVALDLLLCLAILFIFLTSCLISER